MLLDYGEIDHVIAPLITTMDHKFLLHGLEPDRPRADTDCFFLLMPTTAECIAAYIANYASAYYADIERSERYDDLQLLGCVVKETAKTTAEVIIDLKAMRRGS